MIYSIAHGETGLAYLNSTAAGSVGAVVAIVHSQFCGSIPRRCGHHSATLGVAFEAVHEGLARVPVTHGGLYTSPECHFNEVCGGGMRKRL